MRIEMKRRFAALRPRRVARALRSRSRDEFGMDWRISDSAIRKRVVVLVSQQEHCLYDLLATLAERSELDVEIPCVISNHETWRGLRRVARHPVPSRAGDAREPAQAFAEIERLFEESHADTMVLARYMQILPPGAVPPYPGCIINIHHSFLPSFVGAKPYHQAHERGVKLIGATCHYVTEDLDAGPDHRAGPVRIDHGDTVEDLVRYGKDIEKAVLARGLRYHLEDRVLLNGGARWCSDKDLTGSCGRGLWPRSSRP
jgi:formyltetrahydrofolate deformylase